MVDVTGGLYFIFYSLEFLLDDYYTFLILPIPKILKS